MADNFGLRIGIEGEREFKSALREINQSFKVLSSEMNLVSSRFDSNDKSVRALTARNQVLNREIDAQKDKISTLEKAMANATAAFGENDSRTKAWAAQLNNAKAELIGMERQLRNNERTLMSHAEKYTQISDEIETTVREYVKVRDEYGKNSAQAKALEARLKSLASDQKSVGKAADEEDKEVGKVTKSLGLYRRETEESSAKTSIFGDVLKAALTADVIKAGLSSLVNLVKDVGAAVKNYVTEGSDIARAATENHAKLAQVMRNTMAASDDEFKSIVNLTKAQERLGIVSQTTQMGGAQELGTYLTKTETLKKLIPVMNDMVAQQYGVNATQENAVNISTMLGKVMNGQVGALSRYGYSFDEAQAKILKFGTEEERAAVLAEVVSESVGGMNKTLGETDAGKLARANAVMLDMKQTVGELANEMKAQIMGQMLPSISALSAAFIGVLRGKDSVENLTASFNGVFLEITNIISAQLPKMLVLGEKLLTALAYGLSNNIGAITDGALRVIEMLSRALLKILPVLTNAGSALLMGILDGIVRASPHLAEAGIQLVARLASGIAVALPNLVPAALQAVQTLIATLVRLAPELVYVGIEMMSKLAEGLGNANPLIRPITLAISGIMNALKALAPVLVAVAAAFAVFQIVSTIAEMLRGMTLATTAQTIATTAQAAATNVVTAAQWLWNAAMAANPIGLLVAGVAALAAGIAVLVGWMNRDSEEQKALKESTRSLIEENDRLNESIGNTSQAYADKLSCMANEAGAATGLADKISRLTAVENKSAKQKQQLAAYVGMLNEAMGTSVLEYDAETDAMSRNMGEIYGLIAARQEEARMQAARERAVEIAKEQMAVEDQLNRINQQRIELDEAIAAGTIKKSFYSTEINKLAASEAALIIQQDDLIVSFDNATQAVTEAAEKQRAANEMISESASGMTDELKAAHAVQDELSRKRIEQEQVTTEAMVKAASEQGLTLEEYKAKLKTTQKDEEDTYKKREETLKKYTDTATEMFSRLNDKSKVSVSQMTENMKHNQKVMEKWADNLTSLAERGIDKGLLDRLRAAGPESAGTVAALVKASDKELAELNTVFANGSKSATDALLKQLGLPDVVNSGSDMVDDISEGVTGNHSLADATVRMVQEAKRTAETSVRNSGFDSIGRSIIDGVYQGFSSREKWFRIQIVAFFKKTVTDVKSELGIHSRSTVFSGIGENMALGLGAGFAQQMNRVARDMQNAIPTGFDIDTDLNSRLAASGASRSGAGVVQHISVTSPKPLSERELAREFKNLSRKLAIGVG